MNTELVRLCTTLHPLCRKPMAIVLVAAGVLGRAMEPDAPDVVAMFVLSGCAVRIDVAIHL